MADATSWSCYTSLQPVSYRYKALPPVPGLFNVSQVVPNALSNLHIRLPLAMLMGPEPATAPTVSGVRTRKRSAPGRLRFTGNGTQIQQPTRSVSRKGGQPWKRSLRRCLGSPSCCPATRQPGGGRSHAATRSHCWPKRVSSPHLARLPPPGTDSQQPRLHLQRRGPPQTAPGCAATSKPASMSRSDRRTTPRGNRKSPGLHRRRPPNTGGLPTAHDLTDAAAAPSTSPPG